ncbi:MAG: FHA domain-containing protein [Tepidiformaceae bacterium]
MTGATELLLLRLGLIAVIFVFIAVVSLSLRGSFAMPLRSTQGSARPRNWRMVVVGPGESGLARGAEFALAGNMLIGRDGRAGIILPDASVSTRHATVERAGGAWRLADLGSTNGTFVDGRRIGERGVTVRRGAKLTFGNVVLQLESD